MGRSGYDDDCDDYRLLVMWRGQVASAIRGKRGQRMLLDLIDALDNMTVKELVRDSLVNTEGVCALGAVAAKRRVFVEDVKPDDHATLGELFDISSKMVQEIEWINDEAVIRPETPAERWARVRAWAVRNLYTRVKVNQGNDNGDKTGAG